MLPEAAGGLEVDVVFVDTDYSLDMLHLVSILDSKLSAGICTRMHTHTHKQTGSYTLTLSLRVLSAVGRSRRGGAALMSVPPPVCSLLLLLTAPPHPPLPGDHLVITARPGAHPHRQHFRVLLGGSLRGWGQLHQTGGEAQ